MIRITLEDKIFWEELWKNLILAQVSSKTVEEKGGMVFIVTHPEGD